MTQKTVILKLKMGVTQVTQVIFDLLYTRAHAIGKKYPVYPVATDQSVKFKTKQNKITS